MNEIAIATANWIGTNPPGLWWLYFWAMLFSYWAIKCALIGCTRLFRVIKVCARGWPPAHLDADGDWKPKEE